VGSWGAVVQRARLLGDELCEGNQVETVVVMIPRPIRIIAIQPMRDFEWYLQFRPLRPSSYFCIIQLRPENRARSIDDQLQCATRACPRPPVLSWELDALWGRKCIGVMIFGVG